MFSTGTALAGSSGRQAAIKRGLAVAGFLGLMAGSLAIARAPQPADAGAVSLSALPQEAQSTYRLIHAGGPFRYDKDGAVFGNRERILPGRSRGHYREYTVRTPGSRDRGARRIVCGGAQPKAPEVCYFTADHYASFSRIAQ